MKKTIFFLFTLIFLGFISIQAQDLIFVSGVVTNELNGDPVANHDVSIMLNDSSSYYSTIATDQNGFYMDTIFIGGFTVTSIYIMTNDICTFGIHDTLIQNPGLQVNANFEICVDSVMNPECEADFYYVYDSLSQNTVQFVDNSTSTLTINSWTWDFGDGNTSTVQDPIHNYANAGTYNVCLTIESSDFGVMCTDTYCMDVIVQNGGGNDCMADFYYTTDSTGGNSTIVHFYDLSIPVGLIDTWFWDFDDGSTSSEQNPVHTYNASGYYDVCLTITSDSGSCTSTKCIEVYIPGGTGYCEADFYYIQDSTADLTVLFFDQSTPSYAITSWSWSFGDGYMSVEQNPIHNYASSGTYNVCLTIESFVQGTICTDTYCMDVAVQTGGGGDCMANFYYTYDSLGAYTNVVYFHDLSIPVGLIDTWFWEFGDGTTSSEQNPVHAYNAAGAYNVCLTITTDSILCTSTYCESITIQINDNLYLGGNVFADIYQLDHGFAYAYKEENGIITEVFSNIIDSLGYYLFYPMTPADYYVKVEPSPSSAYFSTHLPTYYGDVAHWDDAVLINLNVNVYTADINLIPVSQTAYGPGQIAGIIEYGSGNRENAPAVDIQIMLANEQSEFVGLTYSDDEGKFEFTALPYGTYTLYAEVMGIQMIPKDYFLTEENAIIDDVSMIITDEEIVFGPDGIESMYIDNVSNIYPNPITHTLKLDIGIISPTTISAKIYNQMGQTLIMEQFNMSNTQTIEVNTSGLQSGMYFLEIIANDNYRIARMFIKQ